jgi:hypothetical protein
MREPISHQQHSDDMHTSHCCFKIFFFTRWPCRSPSTSRGFFVTYLKSSISSSLSPYLLPPDRAFSRMKLFASQLNSYQQQSEDLVLDCFPIQNHTNSASFVASSESPVTYGVILEDSCLYPEGGGQPWDLGTIDGHDVVSVESTPKGLQVIVKHPFPIGSRVVCKVDWNRRYDFMQQHSCQHLLRYLSSTISAISIASLHSSSYLSR